MCGGKGLAEVKHPPKESRLREVKEFDSSGNSENNIIVKYVCENIVSCQLNPKFCTAKILGDVNDKSASMLIDTGSSVTIVSEEFADQGTMAPAGGVSITSATGNRVDIIGKCDFRIRIGEKTDIVYNAFVARNFPYNCILGLDILKDCACYIDVANDSLYINGERVSFSPDANLVSESLEGAYQGESLNGIEVSECVKPGEKDITVNDLYVTENLDQTERESIMKVLNKFRKVFAFNDNELGRTNLVDHSIDTGDSKPIHLRPYRIPHSQRKLLESQIETMCANGIVRPSKSPYSAPIVLVPKKDGKVRMCIDFRKLNEVTKKDVYPLPRIDDMLDALNNSKYFSVLDLCQGYHQVPIKESDKEKTAFSFFGGHYEYNYMPFGLCNSAPTFQRLMDSVLSGLLWNTCLVYIDDVIVFSETISDHVKRLEEVLKRFEDSGLKLKAQKCSFGKTEVAFLGHKISATGISPDTDKVKSIHNFPEPSNVSELRSFLGLISYYRKFVKDFASKAAPLHKLLRKGVEFIWDSNCESAFKTFKEALTSYPILRYPDFSLPFVLYTDACDTGIGAVLAQDGPDGERTIAYASKSLKPNEQNYAVIEKEALAIVWGVKYFRHYLFGRKFTVITDHNPLRWLMDIKNPAGRLARWSLTLQEYDITIKHRPGKAHQNADALSRIPAEPSVATTCAKAETDIIPKRSYQDIRDRQKNDPSLAAIIQYLELGELPELSSKARETVILSGDYELGHDGLLYHLWQPGSHRRRQAIRRQIAIPRSLIDEVMYACHDDLTAGHLSFQKTYDKVQERFYWKGMYSDIEFWCKSCVDCATKKSPKNRPKFPLNPLPTVNGPFDRVAVDVLGPFPPTYKSNKYIIVFSDYLTRWPEVFAVNNADAETTARLFVEEIVCRHGAPRELLSDNGKNFRSNLMKEICKLTNTKKTFTTAYHPETNGLVERFNGTLTTMLSMYVSGHQRDWDTFIPYILFAYRTAIHESTKESPFYLMHLRDAVLPIEAALCPPTFSYAVADDYKEEAKVRLQEAYTLVNENLQKNQQKQKEHYDDASKETHYTEGDKIWLYTPVTKPGLSAKLTHHWHGPYKVLTKLSDVTYKLQDPDNKSKTLTSHVNRMKSYVNPNDRPDDHNDDPDQTPSQLETGDDQEIVKILDLMRQRNDSRRLEKFYLVQFKNGKTQWVNEKEIGNFKIIEDFIKSKK